MATHLPAAPGYAPPVPPPTTLPYAPPPVANVPGYAPPPPPAYMPQGFFPAPALHPPPSGFLGSHKMMIAIVCIVVVVVGTAAGVVAYFMLHMKSYLILMGDITPAAYTAGAVAKGANGEVTLVSSARLATMYTTLSLTEQTAFKKVLMPILLSSSKISTVSSTASTATALSQTLADADASTKYTAAFVARGRTETAAAATLVSALQLTVGTAPLFTAKVSNSSTPPTSTSS